jgi:hypothetical protein
MKLQNELSIKSALRFALPCLVSALLFTACSNDDVEPTPGGSDPMTSGTVRFTASAPTSDAVTTRIGIDDANKPSVTDYLVDEPVIWLADDRVSVFFVKEGSAPIHAEFYVDGTSLSDDKKSADLVNITDLSDLNGTYTIYAFTPYRSSNTLESISLDLSSQTQAVNHDNYSHLGNTASMRAAGVGATFTDGSTSNNVNFEFKHITSFLRFHITNSLETAINVTGISLSHANLFTSAAYHVENGTLNAGNLNSSLNLSFDGGKFLTQDAEFDAYFSTFPIATNAESTDELTLTITYDGGDETEKSFDILVEQLINAGAVELFPAGKRYLFDVSLIPDLGGDYPFVTVSWGSYVFTTNDYLSEIPNIQNSPDGYYFLPLGNFSGFSCPDGFDLLTTSFFTNNNITNISEVLVAIGYPVGTIWHGTNYTELNSYQIIQPTRIAYAICYQNYLSYGFGSSYNAIPAACVKSSL